MAAVLTKWKPGKDPGDVAWYWFDWTDFLPEDTTIVSHTVTVITSGVTKLADSHTDKMVRWLASGGTNDADYQVLCVITTNTDEVFYSVKTLPVRNRTDVPA
jgi:hypothetical protein